jgi:hypothetical protein
MGHTDDLIDQVPELVSALVDQQATEEQIRRLTQLLQEDEKARQIYIQCMHVHAELQQLLSGKQPRPPIRVQKVADPRPSAASLPQFTAPPSQGGTGCCTSRNGVLAS